MPGDLGHRSAESLRVLLGHENRQAEHLRALDQDPDVAGYALELEHRGAKRLLDVHDHQRGPLALELQDASRVPTSRLDSPDSSASLIAKLRSRKATVPAASVINTFPWSERPAKQLFAERLS